MRITSYPPSRYAIGTRLWVEDIRDGAVPAEGETEAEAEAEAEGTGGSLTHNKNGSEIRPENTHSGKLRARTAEGWVSLVANDGTVLLVACDSQSDLDEQRVMEELGEWL